MATLADVTKWRPLSKRGRPDPAFDDPVEGIPDYLFIPVRDWVAPRLIDRTSGVRPFVRDEALKSLQLAFRLKPPLNWKNNQTAAADLIDRMERNGTFAVDVLDYMLHHVGDFRNGHESHSDSASELDGTLHRGGSVWEVSRTEDGSAYQLTRRAVGPVRQVIEATKPASTRAHDHLVAAWARLAGRNPDPGGAYREAIRAVESTAKPVILPKDSNATLGKMIAAMKAKPEKWTTTIGAVDDVRRMMESVWRGQLDRHGTDDESVPLHVSPDEADAAFHTCLALTRLFAGGHVRAAGGS